MEVSSLKVVASSCLISLFFLSLIASSSQLCGSSSTPKVDGLERIVLSLPLFDSVSPRSLVVEGKEGRVADEFPRRVSLFPLSACEAQILPLVSGLFFLAAYVWNANSNLCLIGSFAETKLSAISVLHVLNSRESLVTFSPLAGVSSSRLTVEFV